MTERVELRLDTEFLQRIDDWRAAQSDLPTRSEAIRRLVERHLDEGDGPTFRLNNTDRLVMWMLAEVLKNQIGERKNQAEAKWDLKTPELVQQAIYGGHFWALDWELTGIMHSHVDDPTKLHLVVDVLDTWSFIEEAYESYDEETRSALKGELGFRGDNPQFMGFDGNNETEYLGIAQFLVEHLGRFSRFKGRSFNSHMPTVGRYAQMAKTFEPIRKNLIGRKLTTVEMAQLLQYE